ncbi:MAG: glycosyltransferase family 4 protein [Muribaculaceae bacterium]|nr:glycosyltransferase family 4 protein [Muribaculaceae bacterium]MDE6027624.1 glycosyltransferase family 4 protein [Muribaculaceae bacterium]
MKIIILANSAGGLLSFRQELLVTLVQKGYEVIVCLPTKDRNKEVEDLGCKVRIIPIDRRGTNPLKDSKLLMAYINLLRAEKPTAVLTYTIKPNIYGGMACRLLRIPYIVNITGLGSAVESPSTLQKLTLKLYKVALKKADCIFFQNRGNQELFFQNKINTSAHRLIPGSGANIDKFHYQSYPTGKRIKFLFISRLMKEKGIEEYFSAAEYFSKIRSDLEFGILGNCEENYIQRLNSLQEKGIIRYYGVQKDVRPFIAEASCLIHPTFYPEGMSNVILEAASTGRPVITTNRHGCMEAVDDGTTGFLFPQRDTDALIQCIQRFLDLSYAEREEMGKLGRDKMEKEFNRQIVIDAYMEEIERISKKTSI